jgi:fructose/tagatose bisphosphate aldolase
MCNVANSVSELSEILKGAVTLEGGAAKIVDEGRLRDDVIDSLVYTAVFSEDDTVKEEARSIIRDLANETGAIASSIHDLYMAIGRGETGNFTVPAVNIRGMTYDAARRMFRVAIRNDVGAFIFEIAKSEIGYTYQRPSEYASCVLAAAIKEGYRGPVFLQGDHFQFSGSKYKEDPEGELKGIQDLTREAIEAGFYNIDIDPSTLVDYSKPTLVEQQYHNYLNTAKMTDLIRRIEPEGVTVSIGAEIGHIGGKNSTVEECEAFMEGYQKVLEELGDKDITGISKISVQTGTEHGGIPLPDGSIAKVKLDFNVLKEIGEFIRKKYSLSGTVQHGASTLPDELFDRFSENNCTEIHLATGFQNIMYDLAPEGLTERIYQFIKENFQKEWKEGMTEQQFLYKTRKRGMGPFKKEWWTMDSEYKDRIMDSLEEKFEFLFSKLNVYGTREYTERFIKPVKIRYKKSGNIQEQPDARDIKLEEGAD